MKIITSKANSVFKNIKKESKVTGKDNKLLLIEGDRFILDVLLFSKQAQAKKNDFLIEIFGIVRENFYDKFVNFIQINLKDMYSPQNIEVFLNNTLVLRDDLYFELTSTKNPQNFILAIPKPTLPSLSDFFALSKLPRRTLLLENIQNPGNMGSILRLAAAFGTEAVILLGSCVSPFNDKVLRSSMGNIFKLPLYQTENTKNFLTLLKQEKERRKEELYLLGASLAGEELGSFIKETKGRQVLDKNILWAVGNEGRGLSQVFLNEADYLLKIEMKEDVESLNVATATAIFLYLLK